MKQIKKIIISGGGTGGHIFPAIAIANELKKLIPDLDILFVGAENRMEMEKMPAAGYNIIGLPISGFKRKITFENIRVLFRLFKSLRKAKRIINEFKPDAVVGVGGYASGPVLRVAANNNIPTLIQEQNSYAGVTNRLLAKKVDKICVAYQNMDKFFPKHKIVFSGNPVRQNIVNNNISREEAIKTFGLDPNKKTILSIGGSLGAGTINQSIIKNMKTIADSEYQLIWQTGKNYFIDAKKHFDTLAPKNIRIMDFIAQMDIAYKAADIVISRAGAISISELCLVQKPVIFVPSPNVSEDHQTKNAMALVEKDAAILLKDSLAETELIKQTFFLLNDSEKIKNISKNISKFAINNSAQIIAKEIINLNLK